MNPDDPDALSWCPRGGVTIPQNGFPQISSVHNIDRGQVTTFRVDQLPTPTTKPQPIQEHYHIASNGLRYIYNPKQPCMSNNRSCCYNYMKYSGNETDTYRGTQIRTSTNTPILRRVLTKQQIINSLVKTFHNICDDDDDDDQVPTSSIQEKNSPAITSQTIRSGTQLKTISNAGTAKSKVFNKNSSNYNQNLNNQVLTYRTQHNNINTTTDQMVNNTTYTQVLSKQQVPITANEHYANIQTAADQLTKLRDAIMSTDKNNYGNQMAASKNRNRKNRRVDNQVVKQYFDGTNWSHNTQGVPIGSTSNPTSNTQRSASQEVPNPMVNQTVHNSRSSTDVHFAAISNVPTSSTKQQVVNSSSNNRRTDQVMNSETERNNHLAGEQMVSNSSHINRISDRKQSETTTNTSSPTPAYSKSESLVTKSSNSRRSIAQHNRAIRNKMVKNSSDVIIPSDVEVIEDIQDSPPSIQSSSKRQLNEKRNQNCKNKDIVTSLPQYSKTTTQTDDCEEIVKEKLPKKDNIESISIEISDSHSNNVQSRKETKSKLHTTSQHKSLEMQSKESQLQKSVDGKERKSQSRQNPSLSDTKLIWQAQAKSSTIYQREINRLPTTSQSAHRSSNEEPQKTKSSSKHVNNVHDELLSEIGTSARIIDSDDKFLYVLRDTKTNVKIQVIPRRNFNKNYNGNVNKENVGTASSSSNTIPETVNNSSTKSIEEDDKDDDVIILSPNVVDTECIIDDPEQGSSKDSKLDIKSDTMIVDDTPCIEKENTNTILSGRISNETNADCEDNNEVQIPEPCSMEESDDTKNVTRNEHIEEDTDNTSKKEDDSVTSERNNDILSDFFKSFNSMKAYSQPELEAAIADNNAVHLNANVLRNYVNITNTLNTMIKGMKNHTLQSQQSVPECNPEASTEDDANTSSVDTPDISHPTTSVIPCTDTLEASPSTITNTSCLNQVETTSSVTPGSSLVPPEIPPDKGLHNVEVYNVGKGKTIDDDCNERKGGTREEEFTLIHSDPTNSVSDENNVMTIQENLYDGHGEIVKPIGSNVSPLETNPLLQKDDIVNSESSRERNMSNITTVEIERGKSKPNEVIGLTKKRKCDVIDIASAVNSNEIQDTDIVVGLTKRQRLTTEETVVETREDLTDDFQERHTRGLIEERNHIRVLDGSSNNNDNVSTVDENQSVLLQDISQTLPRDLPRDPEYDGTRGCISEETFYDVS